MLIQYSWWLKSCPGSSKKCCHRVVDYRLRKSAASLLRSQALRNRTSAWLLVRRKTSCFLGLKVRTKKGSSEGRRWRFPKKSPTFLNAFPSLVSHRQTNRYIVFFLSVGRLAGVWNLLLLTGSLATGICFLLTAVAKSLIPLPRGKRRFLTVKSCH